MIHSNSWQYKLECCLRSFLQTFYSQMLYQISKREWQFFLSNSDAWNWYRVAKATFFIEIEWSLSRCLLPNPLFIHQSFLLLSRFLTVRIRVWLSQKAGYLVCRWREPNGRTMFFILRKESVVENAKTIGSKCHNSESRTDMFLTVDSE